MNTRDPIRRDDATIKRAPVILAVDQNPSTLADVEAQLRQRYAGDYLLLFAGDPDEATRTLGDLAREGVEVALVLAANPPSAAGDADLFDGVRRLHPHAKRALLVPSEAWVDETTAARIRDGMALGRIDYYVPRPAASPDEVFH
jgi:thioredoxin reductase (NADPH)